MPIAQLTHKVVLSNRDLGLLIAALDWYDMAGSRGLVKHDKLHSDELSVRLMAPFFEGRVDG